MMSENRTPASHRSLLGLRAPTELAEMVEAGPAAQPAPDLGFTRIAPQPAARSLPQRPDYPGVPSEADAGDEDKSSKGSDLMAAIRAGLVLVGLLVALGLLISG